jgi:hypothetical protein
MNQNGYILEQFQLIGYKGLKQLGKSTKSVADISSHNNRATPSKKALQAYTNAEIFDRPLKLGATEETKRGMSMMEGRRYMQGLQSVKNGKSAERTNESVSSSLLQRN